MPNISFKILTTHEDASPKFINAWSFLETIIAIYTFFVLARSGNSAIILYSSLVLAPLFFLRSQQSIQRGLTLFYCGLIPRHQSSNGDAREIIRETSQYIRGLSKIAFLSSLIFTSVFGYLFFMSNENETSFLYSLGIGLIFSVAAQFLSRAIAAASQGVVRGHRALMSSTSQWFSAPLGAALPSIALCVYHFGVLSGILAILVCLGSISLNFGGFHDTILSDDKKNLRKKFFQYVNMLPILFGFWLFTLIVRLIATARHPVMGFWSMPSNISALAFSSSPFHAAELVPGLSKDEEFRLSTNVYANMVEERDNPASHKILAILKIFTFFIIIYFPSWAYRFVLKSTLWFWWVAFIIGGRPVMKDGVSGIRIDMLEKRHSKALVLWAFMMLLLFIGFNIANPVITEQMSVNPLMPAVAILFHVDWSSISGVQYLMAISSILTIFSWFWADAIVRNHEIERRRVKQSSSIIMFGHLQKWRVLFGVFNIFILSLYVALVSISQWRWVDIPQNWDPVLASLYGKYAGRLLFYGE